MRTNTPCTIYNYYRNTASNKEEWHRTVLGGVFWEPRKATNIIQSGLAAADSTAVYIPFSVDAGGKSYLPPKQYAALSPADAASHWTITTGKDRIIKGDISDTGDISAIVAKYDDVITPKSVDTKDYGSPHMRHWEVSGS